MVERYRPRTNSGASSTASKLNRLGMPTAVNAYFDKVQFWLREPLNRESRAWLRVQCRPKGFYADSRRPASFDFRFHERIEVRGISLAGLRWLAQQDGL
jgi:hypothetical protein